MALPLLTGQIFTLVADPRHNTLNDGRQLLGMRGVANGPKRQDGSYGDSLFVDISWIIPDAPWAHDHANTLAKGTSLVCTGRLRGRDYTDKNGTPRTSLDLMLTETPRIAAPYSTSPNAATTNHGGWTAPDDEAPF